MSRAILSIWDILREILFPAIGAGLKVGVINHLNLNGINLKELQLNGAIKGDRVNLDEWLF